MIKRLSFIVDWETQKQADAEGGSVMNKYKIAVLTDSGCDVPQNFREKYNIFMLPLRVMYPEKDYDDGVNIDPMMVYRRFPDEYPSTSTPSLAEVQDMFDRIRAEGYEKIIAVTISSGLSGTFNTIRLAAEQQDEMEIYVFDTKNISVASGIWAIWAAVKLENGWTFEEVDSKLQGIMENISRTRSTTPKSCSIWIRSSTSKREAASARSLPSWERCST